MFQCPHLHTLPEGSNPPHRPADEKDTPPATICKSSESSASSKRSSRIANSVLSEVADQHVGNLEVPFTECMLIKHAKGTVWFMHFHQVWSFPRTDIDSKHSFRPSQLPIDCSTFQCHPPNCVFEFRTLRSFFAPNRYPNSCFVLCALSPTRRSPPYLRHYIISKGN